MDSQYERKTTGILIDEMITAEFKIEAGNEQAKERRHALGNIVMSRMMPLLDDMEKHREFHKVMNELRVVLRECWDAQEVVATIPISDYLGELSREELESNILAVAEAGKRAQETNAQRNRLIRRLEELLNEQPQLEKTYA